MPHNTVQHVAMRLVQLKMRLLQHVCVLHKWYNLTYSWHETYVERQIKNVNLSSVLACRATSSEFLRHIHVSFQQVTIFSNMMSNYILYHILNIARTRTFQ